MGKIDAPMRPMSLTIGGIIAFVVGSFIREMTGSEIPDPELAAFVSVGLQFFGAILAWYGRFRQGDITWYGKKN